MQTLLLPVRCWIRREVRNTGISENLGITCKVNYNLSDNLGYFRLTSIQFCRFAAFFFFNSLFSFDFSVIPVFVLIFRRILAAKWWQTGNTIVGSQQRLFSVPLRSWGRVWRLHQTNFNSFYMWFLYFAWFRYFEFRVVSSGEPEIVLRNYYCMGRRLFE